MTEKLISATDSPGAVGRLVWSLLAEGAERAQSPWHTAVLSTVSDGLPQLRTVVLRRVIGQRRLLMCHTDRRSPKARQIGASAALAWLFYDPVHKLQLRVSGHGRVLDNDDPLTSEQWHRSRVGSRRCYLAPLAPGTPCDVPESGLPRAPLTGSLTREQSEAGRVNFAVVACEASTMDVLQLGAHGHLRLRLRWTAAGSEAGWVAP